MTTTLGWGDVLLRLLLAVVAGTLVGLDRGRHGRAAGLRTMLLVCTAAALSMILANYTAIAAEKFPGRPPLAMDVLRYPLGILSGIGFIGAGAILRRGDMIRGVTTAATLWYMTVVGLCIGSGYLAVGMVATVIALFALFVMNLAEDYIHYQAYGKVTIVGRAAELDEAELRRRLTALELHVGEMSIHHQISEGLKTIRWQVAFVVKRAHQVPAQVVSELSGLPGVAEVRWD